MSNKPVSDRKRAANRANARKSTGPKSPEGQARVSRNAVKHGLFAEHIVLPDDDGESLEELETVWARLREDLDPANMLEELLVERLTASYWRLRRAYRFEVQAIQQARGDADAPMRKLCRDLSGWSGPRMPAQLPGQDDFDKLLRYEGLIDRNLHRITLQLTRLRSAGLARSSEPSDPPPFLPAPLPAGLPAPPAPVPAQSEFVETKPPNADD